MDKPAFEKLPDDPQLLQDLQREGSKVLEQLYLAYRNDFVSFGRRYQSEDSNILDAYQDAIIVLFENVNNGKLNILSSSIKTYLFSVGKYKLIDQLKQQGKTIHVENIENIEEPIENTFEEQIDLSHRQQQLKGAINKLGGRCKDLLILFYYRKYSIKTIQNEMDYKNENVVKAHKSRCMKTLKEIITKMIN